MASESDMAILALTTQQLDYLARQDTHLEPIFRGVFASDRLPKKNDARKRSAYIVNVDTHDKPGSHWLSIFAENDRCEVFDSYGVPLTWYKPTPFVNWIFMHYGRVSSNSWRMQVTDSSTCGHYALFHAMARARGNTFSDFIDQFQHGKYIENDRKMTEKLTNLVTDYVIKLGHEENQQGVLRSVKKHVSLLDI